VRGAREDGFALLLGYTAGEADDRLLLAGLLLETLEPSEVVEDFFFRLLPDAAGIEDDEVRFFFDGRGEKPDPFEASRNFIRVVNVNLTPLSVDEVASRDSLFGNWFH